MSKIKLSKSCIGADEKQAVMSVLDGGFLGMGKEVQLFEQELKAFIGTDKEVICVNTGTAALHLALLCLDLGVGDEVLVPTLTYVASFQAISATGAIAVACDVLESNGLIDLEDAERRITSRTRVIMPVHYASNASGMDGVYALADKYDLRVVEDAAHSFGGTRDNVKIGCKGDVICFSFDGIKNITSGEGGAVVTSDDKLAGRIKDSRLLGVIKDTELRFLGQRSWDFDVLNQGFRYHMSDIMAAIGRAQLSRFEELAVQRCSIAKNYAAAFKKMIGISFIKLDYTNVVPHIFPVFFESSDIRDSVKASLLEAGIETGIHYKPNHTLSFYKDSCSSFPKAEKLYSVMLTLPLHPSLSSKQIDMVINNIETFLLGARK